MHTHTHTYTTDMHNPQAQLFRGLAKTQLPFYIIPPSNSTKRGFAIHVAHMPTEEGGSAADGDDASTVDELAEEAARVQREDEAAKQQKKALDAAGDASV